MDDLTAVFMAVVVILVIVAALFFTTLRKAMNIEKELEQLK
ncbi:MAG: hypothetical protein R6U44_11275 [Archaeoglobaceae archaeon]